MYATSDRRTDDGRRSPLNAPLQGGGIIIRRVGGFSVCDSVCRANLTLDIVWYRVLHKVDAVPCSSLLYCGIGNQ